MTGPTPLTKRQREVLAVYEANGCDARKAAKALGYTLGGLRGNLSYIRSKLVAADDPDSETPSEAKARVAREIASGERCKCGLLRPCWDHS